MLCWETDVMVGEIEGLMPANSHPQIPVRPD